MNLRDLTINYRENPIGLDEKPVFSWKLCGDEKELFQTAYEIIISEKQKVVWDSGKIESDESLFRTCEGLERRPLTKYEVKVIVWDNYDRQAEITGNFETGFLEEENWSAKWITHAEDELVECPVFSMEFHKKDQPVVKGRIYATSLGVYEIGLNEEKCGDEFLSPGWTSYHNRLQYQTYEITDRLKETNRLEITVGNGWYSGYLNCEGQNHFYGTKVALRASVFIEYADGTTEFYDTDENWQVETKEIRKSELYYGEQQDFTVGVQKLGRAVLFQSEKLPKKIVAQQSEPIRITKKISAKKMMVTPKGEQVIDFGQNLAGIVEVKLPKLKGSSLKIHHGETLDRDGNFYVENLRTAVSIDEYIYTDQQVGKVVRPHFTYHGFRYLWIEGAETIDIADFTACAIHTDMKKTGEFTCNDPKINRLQRNIEWGQRSNFMDIPTDCPQRDERLGWTGDAQIFSNTAMYNFNTALFYKKWLRDVAAETDDLHGVPHIVPNIVGPATGTAIWSDCATIIPWNLYQTYGDVSVLEEQYDNMKQWVEYVRRACGEETLWMNGFQRGDWLSLDSDESLHLMSGGTDKNLVANIYYAYSTRILRDTAEILGREEDCEKYKKQYEDIVDALNQEYITPNGRVVTETQTACALLLHFDLLKKEYRDRVARSLKENILLHKGHLTTGFAGTAYLNHALSENGMHSLAGEILFNEDYPGWLYAINKGATTIWERWNSILPDGTFDQSGMNSLNHYSYGAIGDWMYKKLAGIIPIEAGYKKIRFQPVLTKGITKVSGKFESMYGQIECSTTCENGKIRVEVLIPANTTAELILPEKEELIELGSGRYVYEYPTEKSMELGEFSMNSTLEEILQKKEGCEIVEKYLPGTIDNPAISYLKKQTLNHLAQLAPQMTESLEQMIREINGQRRASV